MKHKFNIFLLVRCHYSPLGMHDCLTIMAFDNYGTPMVFGRYVWYA